MTTEEAREQAIEVMALAWRENHGTNVEQSRAVAESLLDALLAATKDEPCATCGGNGYVSAHDPGCWGNCSKHGCPVQAQCEECDGSGRVPGPLVLLAPRQVGWFVNRFNGHMTVDHDPAVPLFRAPLIEAQREEA